MIIGIGGPPKSVDCRAKGLRKKKADPKAGLRSFWERMPERQDCL
ncbi:hypothetical protein [Novosphingobium silvae]|nr:hypothetical protein [Novosphingobium silvae]